jgi:diguanylate cyclase (GGDEF)-like protein/PAS domain S-box-containing protein
LSVEIENLKKLENGQQLFTQIVESSQQIFTQILENIPSPAFVINVNHKVIFWNTACEKVTGVSASETIGTNKAWHPFYHKERPTLADLIVDGRLEEMKILYAGKFDKSVIHQDTWEAEDYFPHFPGGGKWLSFSATLLKDKDGSVIGAMETLRDITKQKLFEAELKEKEHLLSQIIDGCPVPMFVIDDEHKVTHWNRACEAIIGTKSSDIVGTKEQWKGFYSEPRPVLADLVLDNNPSELKEYYSDTWAASTLVENAWEATDHFPNFNAGEKWLFFTAAPLHSQDGKVIGAVETLQDVSSQKKYEEELKYQANHDALSGVANRNLLTDRIEQAIAHAKRHKRLLSVLFIDLDNFKTVNDTFGHNIGDQLIRETAKKIQSATRSGDTVARFGGDEFVVLLFEPENENYVKNIAQRISQKVATSYSHQEQAINIGCSIGIAMYPKDGVTSETLLMNADRTMYRAKHSNKGGSLFFKDS